MYVHSFFCFSHLDFLSVFFLPFLVYGVPLTFVSTHCLCYPLLCLHDFLRSVGFRSLFLSLIFCFLIPVLVHPFFLRFFVRSSRPDRPLLERRRCGPPERRAAGAAVPIEAADLGNPRRGKRLGASGNPSSGCQRSRQVEAEAPYSPHHHIATPERRAAGTTASSETAGVLTPQKESATWSVRTPPPPYYI